MNVMTFPALVSRSLPPATRLWMSLSILALGAIGPCDVFAVSGPLDSWKIGNLPPGPDIQSVVGTFTAVGGQRSFINANPGFNGLEWERTNTGAITLWGITSGKSTLVVVGDAGTILTRAYIANSYTQRTSGTSNALRAVTYGNGLFVAVGGNSAGASSILTSPDAVTWTSRLSPTTQTLLGVATGGGKFVAVGTSGAVVTSPDGLNWTLQNAGTTTPFNGVAYGGGFFVAVGGDASTGGAIFASPNGTAWTRQASGTAHVLLGVCFGYGQFVAVGKGGVIRSSLDGLAWKVHVSPTTLPLNAVTPGAGTFVAVGVNGTILQSGFVHQPTDFLRDGTPDLILRNPANQQTAIEGLQYQNGLASPSSEGGPTPPPSGWRFAAVGDFNRDGDMDFFLHNPATGAVVVWQMFLSAVSSQVTLPTLPLGWEIAGVADLNGDFQLDLLLLNPSTRSLAVWYLDGAAFLSSAHITQNGVRRTLPAGWEITSVVDFNRDRKPDLVLFHPATRQTTIWNLDGAAVSGAVSGPTISAGWTLGGVADFTGDGKPDFLIFNPTTRKQGLWTLDGVTVVNASYVTLGTPTQPFVGDPLVQSANFEILAP